MTTTLQDCRALDARDPLLPLRELFSTFFFVSIGILLQPAAILASWPVVIALLLVITLGKAVPIAGLAVGRPRAIPALRKRIEGGDRFAPERKEVAA